ncbi:MAG: SagB family peptide dehydrogenase [Holophaga sp.]|jgi:SagB-type dehydrogenase family enzyme
MAAGLTLALKPPVQLLEEAGRPAGLEEPGRKRLRLPAPGAEREGFLQALARGGSTEEELCGPPGAALEFRYLLARLEKEGWLCWSLARDGQTLATLEPLTREFRFRPGPGEGTFRLSRFAWIRRCDGGAVLESPLGLGRVRLHGPEAVELVGRLCGPQSPDSLPGLPPPLARAFLSLLVAAGAAAPCAAGGQLPEDRDPALRQWEFHDLLFHSRSRTGRHGDPVGGTYRFLGDIDPLPALKPPGPEPEIPLPEPRPPRPDLPFFQVVEARRSIRAPGREPLTLAQLGTFLHHVARVRGVLPPDPQAGRAYEAVSGPCPGGGGLHEIELYLTVGRCAGLEPGFYHYAAGAHGLERWPGSSEASARMLRQAQESMGQAAAPDLLVTLAARIQRVSWKYQGIAYALILKNAGVLLQQMYLVATALGLAPCAIGAGDVQLFAQASGLDYARESSVGEFALSGGGV